MTEQMLAISYAEGVRLLCLTPHGDPHRFPASREVIAAHYNAVSALCREKFPDLVLYRGNELYGYQGILDLVGNGRYHLLGEGSAVLFEFSPDVEYREMCNLFLSCRSAGYQPVLAHAERYQCLLRDFDRVRELSGMRILLQVNAYSVCRHLIASVSDRFVRRMMEERLVDIVASDAHDTARRSPHLLAAYRTVEKQYGSSRAEKLFYETPRRLLVGENGKERL